MTLKEQRDYIAIQAMTAMIHNDSMMVDNAAMLRSKDADEDNVTKIVELAEAAYNIAEYMLLESNRREKEANNET